MFKSNKAFSPMTKTATTPMAVAQCYNFPKVDPKIMNKRTIAILEFGGSYQLKDIIAYCNRYNIPVPTITNVFLDGAVAVSDPQGADGEVALDICIAASAAPGINIVVVFAPNTLQGYIDGVDKCYQLTRESDVVASSWGGPEDTWDAPTMAAIDAKILAGLERGIAFLAAAGDSGSSDGEGLSLINKHVDYPASSPYAIACGGTTLQMNPDGTRLSETAWSDSGGGVSSIYPGPSWQKVTPEVPYTNRMVPDIAGNADPATGYLVEIDGQVQQVAGTSALPPLFAALICSWNAILNQHVGNLHTKFYANPECFYDVVEGSNGAFKAGVGYDCITGLGVIDGTHFLGVLKD